MNRLDPQGYPGDVACSSCGATARRAAAWCWRSRASPALVLAHAEMPRPGVAVLQLGAPRREHPLVPADQPAPDRDRVRGHAARGRRAHGRGRRERSVDFARRRARRRHVRDQHAPHARGVRAPLPASAGRVMTVPGDDIGTELPQARHRQRVASTSRSRTPSAASRTEQIDDVVPRRARSAGMPRTVIDRNREAIRATPPRSARAWFDEARPGRSPAAALRRLRRAADRRPDGAPAVAQQPHRELRAERLPPALRGPERRLHRLRALHHELPRGHHPLRRPTPSAACGCTGADVSRFCKLCGECIAVCPENLFKEGAFEEHWRSEVEEARDEHLEPTPGATAAPTTRRRARSTRTPSISRRCRRPTSPLYADARGRSPPTATPRPPSPRCRCGAAVIFPGFPITPSTKWIETVAAQRRRPEGQQEAGQAARGRARGGRLPGRRRRRLPRPHLRDRDQLGRPRPHDRDDALARAPRASAT